MNKFVDRWSSDAFENVAGQPLRDTDVNVQKIVYPISVTREKFYYNPSDQDADGNDIKRYLRLDQTTIKK